VPAADFFFALDLSDQSHFQRMMNDVIASIFRHAGLDAKAASELGDELRGALAKRGGRRCDVTFEAHDGTLSISIVDGRGPDWRTTKALP
jgi:hypothetical protein